MLMNFCLDLQGYNNGGYELNPDVTGGKMENIQYGNPTTPMIALGIAGR